MIQVCLHNDQRTLSPHIIYYTGLNPDPHNLPKLDPRDAMLLADPSSSTGYANGHPTSATLGAPSALGYVPWLRKTEYISREGVQKSSNQEQYVCILVLNLPTPHHAKTHLRYFYRKQVQAVVDISRAAQLRDIDASFTAANENFSLDALRHPNNPNITAVESYPLLPDADIWANQYDLFRFSERPGERPVEVRTDSALYAKTRSLNAPLQEDDPRLDCAILRPMKTEHDSFLAFYLTDNDEDAIRFKETRHALAPYEVPEDEEVEFIITPKTVA